jgi:hypothetical protein
MRLADPGAAGESARPFCTVIDFPSMVYVAFAASGGEAVEALALASSPQATAVSAMRPSKAKPIKRRFIARSLADRRSGTRNAS